MRNANYKVLLILPYEPAPFMQDDIEILARYFSLDVLVHNRGKLRLFLSVLRRLLFGRPDIVALWFIVPSYALAVTLMAKVLGAKVAFITGGYDVVSMPQIGFGALRFPLFRMMLKPTLALADLTIPFSRSAARHILKYASPRRSSVVYPSVDTDFYTPGPSTMREALALTISPITESAILQKGLRTFVEAARHAPQMRFVLVGRSPDGSVERLREGAPPNVDFIERFVSQEELRDLYRRASCYVQVSLHEGFGVAVAEAMACEAMPVVTKRFSLPEVTGGLGEYVPVEDPRATAEAALRSMTVDDENRNRLRERVVQNYTLAHRERTLSRLLAEVVSSRDNVGVVIQRRPLKLDLGCGSVQKPGYLGIDRRPTIATVIVGDAEALPVASGVADEVVATCLLEHFDAPHRVLDEVCRVLKPCGMGIFRIPNLGTYSAHLDTTHRFLADLVVWRSLFEGYFGRVEVRPVGTKYRDSRSLAAANWLAVYLFKWYELAQGWDFVCSEPRPEPVLTYVGWWEESEHADRIGGQILPAGR